MSIPRIFAISAYLVSDTQYSSLDYSSYISLSTCGSSGEFEVGLLQKDKEQKAEMESGGM